MCFCVQSPTLLRASLLGPSKRRKRERERKKRECAQISPSTRKWSPDPWAFFFSFLYFTRERERKRERVCVCAKRDFGGKMLIVLPPASFQVSDRGTFVSLCLVALVVHHNPLCSVSFSLSCTLAILGHQFSSRIDKGHDRLHGLGRHGQELKVLEDMHLLLIQFKANSFLWIGLS